MTELMKMVAPVRLYKVSGIAQSKEKQISHMEEGQLFAATSQENALEQANEFWTEQMGYETFTGVAVLIDRIGKYKVVLVLDEQA